MIVLGTIPTAAGEALCFDRVRKQVAAETWPQLARGLRIVPAALGAQLPAYSGLAVAADAL